MSGIYIKGMEMPKTGEFRCVIRKWGEEITIDLYGNEELCGTLIPVPDHGRLIDADALLNSKGVGTQIAGWGKMYHETVIEYAPTIIPADKEEI